MQVIDPHTLAGDLQLDLTEHLELEMDLVSFKASADARWICKAFGFIQRWWLLNRSNRPLLHDLKDLIKSKKQQNTTATQSGPKYPNTIVPLKVRGKAFLMQNSHTRLILALSGSWEEVVGTPTWFLKELEKDLQNRPQQTEPDDAPVPNQKFVSYLRHRPGKTWWTATWSARWSILLSRVHGDNPPRGVSTSPCRTRRNILILLSSTSSQNVWRMQGMWTRNLELLRRTPIEVLNASEVEPASDREAP